LAYVRVLRDTNIWQLKVPAPAHAATPPVPVVASTLVDRAAQLSPDGRKVVFQSDRSGASEIWVAQSDGSHPVPLTSFGRGHSGMPCWSPDGTQIVFESNAEAGHFDIYVISAEGGSPRRLTTGPHDNYIPSWSRDGQWIYFCSMRPATYQVWKVRANGGEAQQVTRNGGRTAFESVDGQWLYYKKDAMAVAGPVWRMPVDGGAETIVVDAPFLLRNFAVATSGIYFVRQAGPGAEIAYYRFDTGQIRPLYTLPKRPDQGLTVSPDEKRILYAQIDQESSNVMLVDHYR
jgi:Tol biopolymer transport system component